MNWITVGSICTAGLAMIAPAMSEASTGRAYNLPAQALGSTLTAIGRISGENVIVAAGLVAGKRAPSLNGRFDTAEALARVLTGTGLRAVRVGRGFVVQEEDAPPAQVRDDGSDDEADIVVTGSRIRGAPVASIVLVRTAETIRDEGQATLGEVIRSIPQNSGGGQNPGIGANVPAASGVNVGSGTSINLRGLGSDATLTLLNGRRLAYSASRQSVDVSAIPANAVERIEVVADGASALYGSDAIAGVANIQLRRDAQGVTTSARLGASTDGGNFEQIYGAVTGGRWGGGGAILAYEFGRNTAIAASDRDYARDRAPGLDLYPSLKRHSVVLSGHQSLGSEFEVSVDLLYNHRNSFSQFALTPGGLMVRRAEQPSESKTRAVAPSLRWSPGAWRFEIAGSSGRDQVRYATNQFAGAQLTSRTSGCYCNDAQAVELSGDGPLIALPGGSGKIAFGVGYRNNRLVSARGDNVAQNVDESQDSRYAYGEISLPLVGAAQGVRGVHRLHASAALRHEDYPGIGAVTTPKLGLVYAPSADFELKASGGRSFRAPTLYQRFQPLIVAVLPASVFGGAGLPPSASAFLLSGGRDELRPERAKTWSVTAALSPRAVEGLRVEASYFETHYRDRIVAPVTFIARALADPIYSGQIERSPSVATLEALRLGAVQFLNSTGRPYDPATVVAIIDNANLNAGRQTVRGVDGLVRYDREIGAGRLSTSVALGYLESEQQLTPTQPVLDLAGAIFNPPHFRGRATLGWHQRNITVTGVISHIGGVEDRRVSPAVGVGGLTQADLTLRYRTDERSGWWRGLDFILTVQNLFNAKPDIISTTLPYDTPYDSTNYSPFGRFLAFSVAKSW